MGRMTYWSILIAAAIMAGALLALPVWDFFHYRPGEVAEAPALPASVAGFTGGPVAGPQVGSTGPLAAAPSGRAAEPAVPSTRMTEPIPAAGRSEGRATPGPGRTRDAEASPAPRVARPPAVAPPPVVPPPRPGTAAPVPGNSSSRPPIAETSPRPGPKPAADSAPSVGWIAAGALAAPQAIPARPPGTSPDPPAPNLTPPPSSGSASAANADVSESLRLSLAPIRPSTPPGGTLTVQVVLNGARDITSVPFHLQFDPAVLQYAGARTGPALDGRSLQPIFLASVNPTRPGDLAVGLSLVRSSGTFSGSGTILLLDFQALAAGRTDLAFDRASVRGPTSAPLPAEIVGATVEVR